MQNDSPERPNGKLDQHSRAPSNKNARGVKTVNTFDH